MIISLFAIPIVVILALVLLRTARNAAEKTAPDQPPRPPRALAPVDDLIGEGQPQSNWTALDDLQLNRLLRESSS